MFFSKFWYGHSSNLYKCQSEIKASAKFAEQFTANSFYRTCYTLSYVYQVLNLPPYTNIQD